MKDLSRGDVIQGVVKALKPYGAFVEVGGMSGLLHISQISYDRIDDLERVISPGMVIKCMIIDHDKVNGRIALSTKTQNTNQVLCFKTPTQYSRGLTIQLKNITHAWRQSVELGRSKIKTS